MKKLLPLLLPFFLQANAQESDYQYIPQGADIENFVDTTYKHPGPRKIGSFMPKVIGNPVYSMSLFKRNKDDVEEEIGTIVGYDKNWDNIPEYDFIRRNCDDEKDLETYGAHNINRPYAAYDPLNRLLYVDVNRDGKIDVVRNIDSIKGETFNLPMKKGDCIQEKPLESSDN